MLESNGNVVGSETESTNGNGAEAPKARVRKRVLTSDLSARITDLEARIETVSAAQSKPVTPFHLEAKIAELEQQLAKLDERVTKIAQMVAQSNLMRSTLS